MSLQPSDFSFSQDRMRAVWSDPENFSRRGAYELHTLINHESEHGFPTIGEAKKLCFKLYESTEDPALHLTRLDQAYSNTYWLGNLGRAVDVEQKVGIITDSRTTKIFDRAAEILGQLPATSPTILGALLYQGPFADGFLLPKPEADLVLNDSSDITWEKLLVVNFVDTIVLRLALCIAQSQFSRQYGPPVLGRLLNATMFLLRTSLDLAKEGRGDHQRWAIVDAFLWTSWQRILTLRLRSAFGRQLQGFDYNIRGLNSMRAQNIVPEIFEYRRKVQQSELKTAPYLCAWAYRNLVEDRACISTDLRRFTQVYRDGFGSRPAICNLRNEQCSGLSSVDCGRFEHTRVTNQSMHTKECQGSCQRLFWCPSSFLNVSGPKAINTSTTDVSGLRYCEVTQETLTVSHVWSHGQGGRPDPGGAEGTGFNMCLHKRYSEIATSLGCSSYWMDTPCIPSEKDLRWECIANITKIFTLSNITLICDRDTMSIDISDQDANICEKLLVTLLVSDWNMRAWTLLEAMRGRRSLYLLCLDDKVIRLYDVLQTVYQKGRIDVAVPFLTRSYLLPPDDITDMELFEGGGSVADEEDRLIAEGFISIGEATVLLSHRHATRDEDDVLIWSLLIGDIEGDAAEMWKRQVGKKIPTGALVSSAPRLQSTPGLRWAPCRPTMARRSTGVSTPVHEKTYLAYDGGDSKDGVITTDGLRARWLTFQFSVADHGPGLSILVIDKLHMIKERHLEGFAEGILLQVCPTRGPSNVPLPDPGSDNHVVVVGGSHDGVGWEWKGIFEWDRRCPLPQFAVEEILLV
ncbi:hypothetical protein LTR10_017974 [Elasticomyces elasticus]|uniref:Heterokaryon incompatibility domain-containing protein n=1 Tax=Exophiala sideris TaxID=1016849 RepID=A0ABR0JAL0_9EURO|nr:hypothetical protein LTR10_017974 [Elasticomyces elasticus]KAK5026070.1 hypothetical protein LTS07_007595 [Exophiala sideris]KAK5032325.1 hypothetical protein LTR13_007148 [Exophiala sideris]KAK5059480.1 hypothetical protein LTR69_006069 [Exophiala sideris]KAK5186643.1 hypothetical protein LTR44_000649 [Eurotiomycetes sp. CCFEE 6388]